MKQIFEGPAKRGSQKWIQRVINYHPEILNAKIKKHLAAPETETITWLSPLANDSYAEYLGESFTKLLDLNLSKIPLDKFWSKRGPAWDAHGKSDGGTVFLVEVKSHIPELVSSPTRSANHSFEKITKSLNDTKAYVNSKVDVDWSKSFYQYTNRLAHLYLLRVLNDLPAFLVFIYFLNDKEMNGPETIAEWKGSLKLLKSYLGIHHNKLTRYVIEVFLDVKLLESQSEDMS